MADAAHELCLHLVGLFCHGESHAQLLVLLVDAFLRASVHHHGDDKDDDDGGSEDEHDVKHLQLAGSSFRLHLGDSGVGADLVEVVEEHVGADGVYAVGAQRSLFQGFVELARHAVDDDAEVVA